jgi:hypothetical protein
MTRVLDRMTVGRFETIANPARVERLIDEAIRSFSLDLGGVTVLTEAASGPFVVTPLIAARAGGSVIAVTRDSRFGTAAQVCSYTEEWARRLGLEDEIEIHVGPSLDRAGDADVITNLGFVRPIDAAFVSQMRAGAAVSLMYEPWEVRPEDVDVRACRQADVPVLGTNERDERLQTFGFVGMLALKLLLDLEVEVLLSRVLVISSEPFASPIVGVLSAAGAEVCLVDVTSGSDPREQSVLDFCRGLDAVVVAEHRDRRAVVGGESGIPVDVIADGDTVLAHIAGAVEDPAGRLRKHPAGEVSPGWMTVTTALLGPRPVVDLHAAGLRVGQALVENMRRLGNAAAAEKAAAGERLRVPVYHEPR